MKSSETTRYVSPIEELYSDADYCRQEILNIRKAIGVRTATQETFEAAIKSLGFMALYCPEEMRDLVYCQLDETNRRDSYRITAPLRQSLREEALNFLNV